MGHSIRNNQIRHDIMYRVEDFDKTSACLLRKIAYWKSSRPLGSMTQRLRVNLYIPTGCRIRRGLDDRPLGDCGL